ncbi:hypothetical protein WJX79_002003 [Trebouxia sp. C0005]
MGQANCRAIKHTGTSAEETHESYIALPSVLTRNFVFKVCGTDAPRSRPLLTKEEVEANKKEYHSQP